MASSVATALEPAAQGASAFLDHPAFCSQLIQGTESDADGMTKGYADALSEAIKSANFGSENEAFAKVGEWCARKIADQKEEAYAKTIRQIEADQLSKIILEDETKSITPRLKPGALEAEMPIEPGVL